MLIINVICHACIAVCNLQCFCYFVWYSDTLVANNLTNELIPFDIVDILHDDYCLQKLLCDIVCINICL